MRRVVILLGFLCLWSVLSLAEGETDPPTGEVAVESKVAEPPAAASTEVPEVATADAPHDHDHGDDAPGIDRHVEAFEPAAGAPTDEQCEEWYQELDDVKQKHDEEHHPTHSHHETSLTYLQSNRQYAIWLVQEGERHCDEMKQEGQECPEYLLRRLEHHRVELQNLDKQIYDYKKQSKMAHITLQTCKHQLRVLEMNVALCPPRKEKPPQTNQTEPAATAAPKSPARHDEL